MPAASPVPRPTPEMIGKWSWRSRVALFLVVGIVSTVAGAVLFPGSNPASKEPSAVPSAVQGGKAKDRGDADRFVVAPPRGDPLPGRPTPQNDVEDTPARSTPVGWARHYDTPFIAPRRLPGRAGELAAAIDRQLDKTLAMAPVPASPLADDAEFLRRVYLDLTGTIPSHSAAVAFLNNPDSFKRARLIDELLASPAFGKHLAQIWTDILVKRDFDNNKNLKTEAFTGWLGEHFNKGTGWNKIVSELLTADGKEDEAPQALFFLANQDNNQPAPDKLVAAVGNLFMGVQIQCAQCHVHPFVSRWGQQDFWGMAAFFGHTRLEREGAGKNKRGGLATIKEVEPPQQAARGKPNNAPRTIPPGAVIAIPDPNDTKKTTGTARAKFFEGPLPLLSNKGPYRPALAAWLTSPRNKYFATATVNRLWAHLFARGFVNPLEDMNDKNKPSHPELLDKLAVEFGDADFDLKLLLRAMANTNAYQRTSRPLASNSDDDKYYSHMPVKVLGARELLSALVTAVAPTDKAEALKGRLGPGLVRFFDTREVEGDPTEFTQGIPQMLRLMNSPLTNGSAAAASRIVKNAAGKPDKIIENLYLTALSRRPHPAEAKRMLAFVGAKGDKGYAGVFWALLNSAEFASNH